MYNIVEICQFHKKWPTESGGRLIRVTNFEVCAEKHNEINVADFAIYTEKHHEIKWSNLQFKPKNTMKQE
jgi:hypothetical protein